KESGQVKLPPQKIGEQMSSLWSTKANPKIQAGKGDYPFWSPQFNKLTGTRSTHHNIGKYLDLLEQAKAPKTPVNLSRAAAASKWRLPDTIDLTERAVMDWEPISDPRVAQGLS